MKQIVKKNKVILTGTSSEIVRQIKLLADKYGTLKALLDDYAKG